MVGVKETIFSDLKVPRQCPLVLLTHTNTSIDELSEAVFFAVRAEAIQQGP
jgi:hypothetical protein